MIKYLPLLRGGCDSWQCERFRRKIFQANREYSEKIEATYQNQFRTQGALIGQQFYAERNALFTQLKPLLNKVVRKSLKFNDYNDMKRVLGLSTQSIVHEWSTVGIGAIPGYATYVNSAAKAAAFMKMGAGWHLVYHS